MSFGSLDYSVGEGSNIAVIVNRTQNTSGSLSITIRVSHGSAEDGDYTVPGLSNGRLSLSFSDGDDSESFTIRTHHDSDCNNETVNVRFGTLPSGVDEGSHTSATVTINDDDACPTPPGKPQNLTYTPARTEGRVVLDWDAASGATGYQVRQCVRRHNNPNRCDYSTVQTLGSGTTIATVSGLATGRLHDFRIRATKGSLSADTDTITVNLKPAPRNLTGAYVAGQHRKLTLTWDPVPNPDVGDDLDGNYHVEQLFPNNNPLDSGWKRLTDTPRDGVTIGSIASVGGKLMVVVSGLTPGESYQHRIKAESVQGKSVESNVVTTTVTDESPTVAPPTPTLSLLIGNRGIQLDWTENVPGADSYQVSATPDSPSLAFTPLPSHAVVEIPGSFWVDVGKGSGAVQIFGLTPGTRYTFSVRGHNGSGGGPAASAEHVALEPTHWWGHQADHTVGYIIGNITEPLLQAAIPDAVADWNGRLNFGLEICDDSDRDCNRRNSDRFIATIKTVAPSSPSDNITGCGRSVACVSPTGSTIESPGGVGRHMTDMDVIFEDPPYGCTNGNNRCRAADQVTYEWTNDPNKSHVVVDPTISWRHLYLHAGHLALHELGHTLGAPDFYSDVMTGLDGETAIMNLQWDAKTIQDEDIAQLDAIYRTHSSHSAR